MISTSTWQTRQIRPEYHIQTRSDLLLHVCMPRIHTGYENWPFNQGLAVHAFNSPLEGTTNKPFVAGQPSLTDTFSPFNMRDNDESQRRDERQQLLPAESQQPSRYDSVEHSDDADSGILSQKKQRRKRYGLGALILVLVAMGSLTLGLCVTVDNPTRPIMNNGTHDFHPTVIMISLDGVVNHDLDLHITPNLARIASNGMRAHWMTPSFPSITFPNHWTLVTGLFPEAHGIVNNYFYDPVLNDTFNYKDPAHSWDMKWWGGEPIWITAVRQGRIAGAIMWPGCSVTFNDLQPSLSVPYSDAMTMDEKVDQALEWIDLPMEHRPEFIGLYVPQVDQAGHREGPFANETMKQLRLADAGVGRLVHGLSARNLTEIIHVIVVSDHGMSQTDVSRLIYYDDELTPAELALIATTEGDPLLAIRPPANVNQTEAVDRLYNAFKRLQRKSGHFEVYKRESIPTRYHYSHNERIAPLLVVPEAGWLLITHQRYDRTKDGDVFHPRGTHGYDNLSPQMRAFFVGQGPTFSKDVTAKPFQNIEVYEVLTRILNLKPAANNGTLRGHLQIE